MVVHRLILPKVKPTCWTTFFSSCFNSSCPPITPNPLETYSQANLDPSNFPEILKCSTEFVADMLVTLNTSKSSGPDGISSRMLKSSAYSIAPSITRLFDNSLAEGKFPIDWKLARVVPLQTRRKILSLGIDQVQFSQLSVSFWSIMCVK